jgi:hypothetical protein
VKIRLALLTTSLAVTAIGFAAPADAGCETQPFARYCDGPIRTDGTFDRCQTTFGNVNAFGAYTVPPTYRCYPVDPAQPWPMFPLGQPQHYIAP